jgi:hypothetical protein
MLQIDKLPRDGAVLRFANDPSYGCLGRRSGARGQKLSRQRASAVGRQGVTDRKFKDAGWRVSPFPKVVPNTGLARFSKARALGFAEVMPNAWSTGLLAR